ncbi:MAG: hypothetical protein P8X79_16460 [Reinekea sp.]
MYQELFSLGYQHEYFNEGTSFNLHCKLSSESTRLSMAMDAVLVVRQGGFKYLWNNAHYTRQGLLENFSGQSIVIYMSPFDTEQFFNITDKFPVQYQYPKPEANDDDQPASINAKACSCVQLLHASAGDGQQLTATCQPVDKLLKLNAINEVDRLNDISLTDTNTVAQPDSELKSLYDLARRKPIIALVVPINELAKSNGSEYQLPTFVSDAPVKLKRQPDLHYQLISEKNGVEEVIFDALPQPNIQQYFKHNHPQQGPISVLEAFIK